MKKVLEDADVAAEDHGKSTVRHFFKRQADKLKHGQFTCPFCKEVSHGLSEFGAHLKNHCT